MATLLDNDHYGCLGLTLHAMLEQDFGTANFNMNVYQKAYMVYLRKHKEVIQQYTEAMLALDHTRMSEIITTIYRAVQNGMQNYIVHVYDNRNYVKERMRELIEGGYMRSPNAMVEAIKCSFFCDEMEINELDQAVKNLRENASVITYTGHTMDDDMTVMIFYLCDF